MLTKKQKKQIKFNINRLEKLADQCQAVGLNEIAFKICQAAGYIGKVVEEE